jgi:restriction endonuclease S subunit
MAIRPRKELSDLWFMYFALRQRFKIISQQATGATIPGLSTEQIKGIELRLPSLEIQRRIGSRLRGQFECLEQLVSALSTQLAALDALSGAFLREAFGTLTD